MNPISILIPCYNEAPEILISTIESIKKSFESANTNNFEIIVINDGSKKYNYSDISIEKVLFIEHSANKGYGAALKTGIKHSKYDWIGITDADGTYPNHEFSTFMHYTSEFDMIVGARPWKSISALRKLPKFILTKFSSFLAGYKILDLNSGMRIFKKEMAMQFWGLYPNGFSFTSTITMGCVTNGYNLKYLTIDYNKREGKSHIHPIKDTLRFFTLVSRLALYFNPLKVFIPLSILFLALAIARGIRDYILVGSLGGMSLVLFFMAFQVFFFGLLADIMVKNKSIHP